MSRILLHDEEKIKKINPESITIYERYKIDMVMRNLSERTQQHYVWDLQQWLIWVLDNQGMSVLDKDKGVVSLDGQVDSIYYSEETNETKKRLFGRIFN